MNEKACFGFWISTEDKCQKLKKKLREKDKLNKKRDKKKGTQSSIASKSELTLIPVPGTHFFNSQSMIGVINFDFPVKILKS